MQGLRIHDLTFKYPRHAPLLKHVNATFRPSTISLITGASGTGKSTLLKLMAGLLPLNSAQHGSIDYGSRLLTDIPATQLSNYVAMMFQDPNRQFAMRTVKHELIFTLENRQVSVHQISQKVNRILQQNHISQLKNRQLTHLSGGEKQRVALAIITALNSKVILLDEPFANVDAVARSRIMNKLVALKHTGKIIVIVDHDLRGYQKITDQLLILCHQRLQPVTFKALQNQVQGTNHQWSIPSPKQTSLYQLRHFAVGYEKPLIKTNNFKFYAHRATLITGPNGSGKSTLFRAMLKLIKYRGTINYCGKSLSRIKSRSYYHHVNLVFLEATDQFLEITVRQELKLSLRHQIHKYYSQATVKNWLRLTGLSRHLDQVVYSLSGGQQKTLQLIEALINGAPVMLMDEPFRSLDHRLIKLFKKLLRQAVTDDCRTLIVISHQVVPVANLFDYHVQLSTHRLKYLRRLRS